MPAMGFIRWMWLLGTVLVLSGCARAPVQTYEGEPRASREVAIVKGDGNLIWRVRFIGYKKQLAGTDPVFQRLLDPDLKSVLDTDGASPNELRMLPGHYFLLLYCKTSNGYSEPAFELEAEAGMTYEIGCKLLLEGFAGNKSKVKATLDAQYPTTAR